MNIYNKFLHEIKISVNKNKDSLKLIELNDFKGIVVEGPPPEFNYDLSCNISLILAKKNKTNPNELANRLKTLFLQSLKGVKDIQIAGPGFLNIKLNDEMISSIIYDIFQNENYFGSFNSNKKYNIEFVSANPTGPMHVGHCRGAIYGDVLANLLLFNGNEVEKEYYINDYGNQIINFTKSVFLRIREIKYLEKFNNTGDLYPGDYIIGIAKNIIKDNPKKKFENFNESYKILSEESLKHSMSLIKSDLKKLNIKHDKFTSETAIVNKNLVQDAVELLKKNNFVEDGFLEPPKGEVIKNWTKTKRLIFKSTKFGDDSDRALKKDNGSWTYFANDIAYHMDKVQRKYDYLINVLGADHTGYIKRITAAVSALSNEKVKLDCRVCQLVKLFKNGKPFKMSKRSGNFISTDDLLKEVDKDSIRFMMLNRSNDVELDFDFDKILEKSKDNPVFYVQYCFARINSLFRSLKINLDEPIKTDLKKFEFNDFEVKILRKIFDWPKIIETASKKYEPHRIPFYLYDLATLFHSYWSKGNEDKKFKFIIDNKINNYNSIVLIKLVSIVIKNGMKILDVSLPEKM